MRNWLKIALLAIVSVICGTPAFAQNPGFNGFCQLGAQLVTTQGLTSVTKVQASYPKCTVTVYQTGTLNLANIFSTAGGSALANPFQANNDGSILFFAIAACYDIVTSASTSGGTPIMPNSFTYTDVCLGAGGGGGGTGTVCGTAGIFPGPNAYFTALATVCFDALVVDNGAGTMTMIAAQFNGPFNGFHYFSFNAGGDPALSAANSTYLIAPNVASFPSIGLHLPSALAPADNQYGICQTSHSGQYDVLGWCQFTVQNYILQVNGVTLTNGDTVNLVNGPGIGVTKSTVGSTDTVNWYANRTCMIVIGANNGSVLGNGDLAPQTEQCQVNGAATILEIDVTADTGTSSIVVAKRHCTASPCASNFTVTDLLSSALATVASGGPACSKTAATLGYDGFTTCASTLQNTAIASGDYIETHTGTADGTAHRFTIAVHFQE